MIKKIGLIVLLIYSQLFSQGQTSYPQTIEFSNLNAKSGDIGKYDFAKKEKKAFLFFDIKSEAMAELMYSGCNFVFDNSKIAIFPIYFTGQLTKKPTENFKTKIPIQLFKSPFKSEFVKYNINEDELPILLIYNEKNEFCGVAKKLEEISNLDCGNNESKSKILKLKILTEEKNKKQIPYVDKSVYVISTTTNDTVATAKTNKYGDFNAEIKDLNQDYLITVDEKKSNINFVVLSTQSGKEIGKFKSSEKGFVYRLLQTELVTLPDISDEEEDLELKFTNLKNKNPDDFILTENLFYEFGKSTLSLSSKKILDKIKNVLTEHPRFNLLVISHTDSQGDESDNLKLSIKRSEEVIKYLNSVGTNHKRLKADGKGETEIRNRCFNDVDCSDVEHEYNRRTEFKFTKK